MTVEISSSNAETKATLRALADAEPDNVLSLPISPMIGQDVLTLAIENYLSLSMGTAAMIAVLKTQIDQLRITKDGLELSAQRKSELLDEMG